MFKFDAFFKFNKRHKKHLINVLFNFFFTSLKYRMCYVFLYEIFRFNKCSFVHLCI